jgi:protein TonB
MTVSERWNYLIAGLLSLAFHILIGIMALPQLLTGEPVELDTFPVGVVELAGGIDAGGGPAGVGAEGDAPAAPAKPVSAKPVPVKPQPVAVQPGAVPGTGQGAEAAKSAVPPQDGIAVGPKVTGAPLAAGSGPAGSGLAASGGAGGGLPIRLGNGEKQVAVLGAMPPYPKNALNEGAEGDVALRILVRANGQLERIALLKSGGDERLNRVAVRAVEQNWQFKPGSEPYLIELTFVFRVDSGVGVKFIKAETRP